MFVIVKMSVPLNLVYKYNSIPIKIPANYFVDIAKLILKFIFKGKRPSVANKILKNKVKGLMLFNSKTYCEAIVIKAVSQW